MSGRVHPGSVVRVPVHGRRMRAFVIAVGDEPAVPSPKPLSALVSADPLFDEAGIALARWTADRYLAPLSLVLHHAVPGRYSAPALATAAPGTRAPQSQPAATGGLAGAALASLRSAGRAVVVAPTPRDELDVVAAACAHCRAGGGRALVVTARTADADALAEHIADAAVLHGDLSPARRARAWAAARDGAAAVVVGGRGAVFVPLPGLRLVAVIGAHDRSLKEERWPRIHAVVVAARRALDAGAWFLATSCSPPLELTAGGSTGDGAKPQDEGAALVQQPRSRSRPRPEIASPWPAPVTPKLLDVLRTATDGGVDGFVSVVRKGSASRVRCTDCAWYPRCTRCATTLVPVAGGEGLLRCRSCARTSPGPEQCPHCGGSRLRLAGWGADRVAGVLRESLEVPVVVLDADHEEAMPPPPAVVVGTSAAIPLLRRRPPGAVAVADVDQLLALPDFRAAERAFQTLSELSAVTAPGGRFLVQTREPEHHAVQGFVRGSYRWFAERELLRRRRAGYPPFSELVRVDADPKDIETLRGLLGRRAEVVGPLVRPGGPAGALVRTPSLEAVAGPLRDFARSHPAARLDIDPVDVL